MRKLFTSVLVMLLVGACSSVPLPMIDRSPKPETPANVQAEALDQTERETSSQPVAVVATNVNVNERTKALFNQALKAMAESNTTVATALLTEITERQPELAGPWVNLSIIAEQQGDADAAKTYLATAIEKNPNNCDALVRIGIRHRRAGDFAAAESSYHSCLRNNPAHSLANLNLGILYELYMGRYADALALYHEYQLAEAAPNPKVNIWITDLERRVAALAKTQDAAFAKR